MKKDFLVMFSQAVRGQILGIVPHNVVSLSQLEVYLNGLLVLMMV